MFTLYQKVSRGEGTSVAKGGCHPNFGWSWDPATFLATYSKTRKMTYLLFFNLYTYYLAFLFALINFNKDTSPASFLYSSK